MIALNHITARLNANKVIKVLDSLQTHPRWSEPIIQSNILVRFATNPPEASRISDFIKKISIPLEIPFYIIWTWMCSDFTIHNLDPFVATENYLRTLLSEDNYEKIKNHKGPINFRKALRAQRTTLRLSLNEMADKVGVDRDKIAVLERKGNYTSMPRWDTLNAILPAYELHPIELLLLAINVAEKD